jgi:hypothetical protein
MNAADAYALSVGQFKRIIRFCDAADDSEDADPWGVIDDIRAICQDTLASLGDVRP